MTSTFDVCIVGGGPAGSTLALRLTQLGFRVVVVERSMFDSAGEGESVDAEAPGSLRVERSLVRWTSDDVIARDAPQFAILRPRFDAQLLDQAREAGAIVMQPATATAASRTDDGWRITIDDGRELHARFVADASGRASWLRTARTRTSARTLAMRASFRDGPDEARVEALEEGWVWGSPMPDGTYAVVAFAERPCFAELLRASSLFRDLGEPATLRCHDATSYAADAPCEERLLRLGDASHSLDPLSSSGIRSAIQSAIHGAIVINTILRAPERAALAYRFYEEAQQAALAQHLEWTRGYYAESRMRDRPFWRMRGSPSVGNVGAGFSPPMVGVTFRFAGTIAEVPCIVGDFVEIRRGITHAALRRPFVWIGGFDAVPLVAPLARGAVTRDELVAQWTHVPPARREEVFRSLLRSGILAPEETA